MIADCEFGDRLATKGRTPAPRRVRIKADRSSAVQVQKIVAAVTAHMAEQYPQPKKTRPQQPALLRGQRRTIRDCAALSPP